MEVMKKKESKTFSYSVFYEQAPEGGYVAFVPHSQVAIPKARPWKRRSATSKRPLWFIWRAWQPTEMQFR